ncbi:MAG: large-conductance mechanosensitive channel protein MscL [Peptostreptococcaceae bacterium]|nr:large-conductance mechanosensitive channel protein MscL [Peptostreptococcaceae bacterium]
MLKDFKLFVMKGNVLDLAVAVIIGGAFGKIIASLVNDVIMPIIGILMGNIDIKTLKILISPAVGDTPEAAVYYGMFIQNIVDFLIIAFFIFLMIRLIEKSKRKQKNPIEETVEIIPEDTELLREIRDLLKK